MQQQLGEAGRVWRVVLVARGREGFAESGKGARVNSEQSDEVVLQERVHERPA
jgi:hypothetical protein